MRHDMTGFAMRLAQSARRETVWRWINGCEAEDKGGSSSFDPVTEADRAAERAMRELIEQEFPSHGISGEEFGVKASSSAFCWSLDPIDGTRSFTCGLPTWVTLIALLKDGAPIIGVIDAPALDELYVGEAGAAVLHGRGGVTRIATSPCTNLSEARVSTTDPGLFDASGAAAFEQVRTSARTVRYGHDGYGYARVAAGTIDLVIEAGLKEHDYQALIPVVRGAGGTFGDWRGGQDYSSGKVIAAATPEIYEAAVRIMRAAG
jgi:myo-inositol-1(or 4)-monophosphatase